MTELAAVVAALTEVGATTKRTSKRDRLAALLRLVDRDDIPTVVGLLVGQLRQGRIGIGWAAIRDLAVPPASAPSLTVEDIDAAVDRLARTTGSGSQQERHDQLVALFARATPGEQDLLARVFGGELRTGALAGVVTDAVAAASGVGLGRVQRAVMLSGDLGRVAALALGSGEGAVRAVGLAPLQPVLPMLAATSATVAEAVAEVGRASVEWKLDGARIQVHRSGDVVRLFTRNLNDVTDRLPEVAAVVRGFPASVFVLDGEILGFMGPDETPEAFQDTMSRFGRDDAGSHPMRLVPQFFDILHLDGVDLIDEPLERRRALLADLVGPALIPGVVTDDAEVAGQVLREALERGHEGVMVKGAATTYEAGRRGKGWRKVKPVHTFDLVVLAAEWGHGRRTGWLSNLHLGARDPATGDFVMVGKTFKGLTDDLLRWQTARFAELETHRSASTVWLRPEQVIEIAIDGVQVSTRYPGGVALRFARVRRYRDDKPAAEADTITDVRAHLRSAAATDPTA